MTNYPIFAPRKSKYKYMGLIKIFSGKESIAKNLHTVVEKQNVTVTQRENKQNSGNAAIIELFIEEDDFMKVRDAIEDFKMNM